MLEFENSNFSVFISPEVSDYQKLLGQMASVLNWYRAGTESMLLARENTPIICHTLSHIGHINAGESSLKLSSSGIPNVGWWNGYCEFSMAPSPSFLFPISENSSGVNCRIDQKG